MSTQENGTEFAGSLRERIRIERLAPQRDTLGSAVVQVDAIGDYWAAVEADGVSNETQAESRSSLQRWRITLRQTQDILPGDHLIWMDHKMIILKISAEYRPIPKTILLTEERR